MSRLSVRRGEACELAALMQLRAWGCLVDRIATPIRMVRGKPMRTAKVFADIVGINAIGKGLLCECKNYGRKPRPSDFRPHQVETLRKWAAHGGVALVAWIESGQVKITDAGEILAIRAKVATTTDHEPTAAHRRKVRALEKRR